MNKYLTQGSKFVMVKENEGYPPFSVPVLLIIFNRLECTKAVLESIKKIKPDKLYIASDGARPYIANEHVTVNLVRTFILDNIDWDCKVKTLFRDTNHGCGPNVKESIDWFFKEEEYGIILEDDCVPVGDFFRFCEELLIKYRYDSRIGMIAGTNHISRKYQTENDYLFSAFKACWGWATWSRAWNLMDFKMTWRRSNQVSDILQNMGPTEYSNKHWRGVLKAIDERKVSAWDWQWYFSLASQNQLCIFPSVNLVSNVGFGDDATHTVGKPKKDYLVTGAIGKPINHPEYICRDHTYDIEFERLKIKKSITSRFKALVPKYFKNIIKNILYSIRILKNQ